MRSQPSSWVRKCQSLRCLPWETTSACTLAPLTSGAPSFTSAPSPTSSTSRSSFAPTSWISFSTLRRSPSLTRYCFPPVLTTAYIGNLVPFRFCGSLADREIPPPGAERNGRSSGEGPGMSSDLLAGRGEGPQACFVGGGGDAPLGDDGGDVARGRDVESGVEDGHAFGCHPQSAQVRDLLWRPLLDWDVATAASAKIEGADRRGDEERHSRGMRRQRQRIGAHLVGGVAVAGDAIGAHHHAPDAPRPEQGSRGDVGKQGDGDAILQQLPRRQPRALQPGTGLVGEDRALLSALQRC